MKKKIITPKFWDNFNVEDNNWYRSRKRFNFEQHIFSSFNLFFTLIIILLILGFFYKHCLVLSLSLATTLYAIYLKNYMLVKFISIKMTAPSQAVEYENFIVNISIFNKSNLSLNSALLIINFDGTIDNDHTIIPNSPIRGGSMITLYKDFYLNGGMGQKNLSSITIIVTDCFNLFPFYITYACNHTLDVFPKIEPFPKTDITPKLDSQQFGIYKQAKRGESSSFIGVREYQEGDPIKKINWKLSLKSDKVIVNEFEKDINGSINIILNTNLKAHSGFGELSTFEYCRDIILSLGREVTNDGHQISLYTNNSFLGKGQGQKFFNYMTYSLPFIELFNDDNHDNFLKNILPLIKPGETIALVTSFITAPLFQKNLLELYKFAKYSNCLILIFNVCGFDELLNNSSSSNRNYLSGLSDFEQKNHGAISKQCKIHKIKYYNIFIDSKMGFGHQVVKAMGKII